MHFNYIFDYHFHFCEKNMTVPWLLLTVSLVVLQAALIYLHSCRLTGGGFGFGVNKYVYEAIRLLRFNLLISRKSKHFSDCTESCIESHSLHAAGMFSSVPPAQQEGESPKLLTKHSVVVIAEFQLYYMYTYIFSIYFTTVFNTQ